MSQLTQNQVNFYPNDSSSTSIELQKVPYVIGEHPQRWEIQGSSSEIGLFNPGSLNFQICQVNLTMSRCVELWNKLYQNSFQSWSNTDVLKVYPQVDYRTLPNFSNGFNAYYDRANLVFFYDKDILEQKDVFTSESLEIVSHEAGHAVLDAIRPEFFDTFLPEIAAFHEAFGDCSAIMTTLIDSKVRKEFLKVNNPLHESNLVSRLAEAMGHGIFSKYGINGSSKDSLRDAINQFSYKNPTTLPDSGPDYVLTQGGHSFSRVFTGAFYESLVRMHLLLNNEMSEAESLQRATEDLGKIFSKAVLSTAPANTFYREVALSMLKFDKILFQSKYNKPILESFIEKKILSPIAMELLDDVSQLHSTSGAGKSLEAIIPKGIDEIKSNKFLKTMADYLGIPTTDQMKVQMREIDNGNINMKVIDNQFAELEAGEKGLPEKIKAYVPSEFIITVDVKKNMVASHSHITDMNIVEEAQQYLRYLIRTNKIYKPSKEEKIDKMKLAVVHKPWYITPDSKIVRAYFA